MLDEKELEKFLNGVKLDTKVQDGICRIYNSENVFIGIGEIKNQKLKRDIIL